MWLSTGQATRKISLSKSNFYLSYSIRKIFSWSGDPRGFYSVSTWDPIIWLVIHVHVGNVGSCFSYLLLFQLRIFINPSASSLDTKQFWMRLREHGYDWSDCVLVRPLIWLENSTSCFLNLSQTPKKVYIKLGKHYSGIVCLFLKIMYRFASRSSLQDQNTKVAVVLIQKNAPLPPGKTH